MNPQKLRIPALVHHKSSGQGVVLLRDKSGTRRMVYLGKHGSTECERRYRMVLADYLISTPPGQHTCLSVRRSATAGIVERRPGQSVARGSGESAMRTMRGIAPAFSTVT